MKPGRNRNFRFLYLPKRASKRTYMAGNQYYTTFKISRLCGVNPSTVQNWIKERKLRAFQTPGGHRRVSREDLIAFLNHFGMPVPQELERKPPRILIVDDEADVLNMIEELMLSGSSRVEIEKAQNGVEALLMIGERKPDLLVLDLMMPEMNGSEVCSRLKANPGTRNIRIAAISGDHNPDVKKRILRKGADLFFTKPLDLIEFRKRCFGLLDIEKVNE
jgi:excisionase family DNA binding protein